jgi:hypothetical protein
MTIKRHKPGAQRGYSQGFARSGWRE